MPTATRKPTPQPVAPVPEITALPSYPTEIPPLDGPPLAAFGPCRCGALLIERIWHNRTEKMEAHWEICAPPRLPIEGGEHVCPTPEKQRADSQEGRFLAASPHLLAAQGRA